MPRYSEQRKAVVLKKLLPPHNQSVAEVAREEGISEAALYNWRMAARNRGIPVPGKIKGGGEWPSEAKLAVVIETATMSEEALSVYCREKGLYPEQIQHWKQDFVVNGDDAERGRQQANHELREERKRSKSLARELQRKEKALAEAAALLVLQKKFNAFLEEKEDE